MNLVVTERNSRNYYILTAASKFARFESRQRGEVSDM